MAARGVKVLLAREAAAAEASAALLRAQGVAALAAPVAQVEFLAPAIDLAGVQALAFTSQNGVRAFAAASPERHVPAYAVGPATAAALEAEGFASVIAGPADGAALAGLLRAQLDPGAGAVLHLSGDRLAFDVAAALEGAGFAARRLQLYRTVEPAGLPPEALAWLFGPPGAVLFYSAKGAEAFARLCAAAAADGPARRWRALCLSRPVAETALALGWAKAEIAAAPNEPALFALLSR